MPAMSPLPLLLLARFQSVDNRFILLDQSDFGAKKGFYLSIENHADGGAPLALGKARLIFGVANGREWHFMTFPSPLEAGHTYEVAAKILGGIASFTVNGAEGVSAKTDFEPFTKPLTIANQPAWASAPAPYRIVQGDYSVACATGEAHGRASFAGSETLAEFEQALPVDTILKLHAGDAVTIKTSFRVVIPSDDFMKGIVDRFGQATAAEWPDKVRQDSDLVKSGDEEAKRASAWKRPVDWDAYGGLKSAPWHVPPTGYYRTIIHGGKWWLVTPDGNPVFYTGLCSAPTLKWDMTPVDGRQQIFEAVPPRNGSTEELWVSWSPWGDGAANYFALHSWNLIRKFGDGWKDKALAEFRERLAKWGFSGLGKWCDGDLKLPNFRVIRLGVPNLVRHPDVFDPEIQAKLRAAMEAQVGPFRQDPFVVGYTIGSEYDEIVNADETRAILRDHADSAAAKAIAAATGATATSDSATIERARRFYATAYYSLIYKEAKRADPNHLYFGFWIVPGWWENDSDWDLIEPFCDVIGYDRYALKYEGVSPLVQRHDKPTFIGEFSYPAWYGGHRGYGRFSQCFVESDADSGQGYAECVAAAARDPRCVGMNWFQYRDEPITGRGPGRGLAATQGEHYAFGFVDTSDRPKWDLVTRAREANLRATKDRLEAK